MVRINEGAPTAPRETQTKDRVYATLDENEDIKYITFYDEQGLKKKQFDLSGNPHYGIEPPHTHLGYNHKEGFHDMTKSEWKETYRILRMWNNYKKGFKNGF